MNHLKILIPCFLCVAFLGCQTDGELTSAETQNIESDVLTVFNKMVDGMNEHDADKILECYLQSESLRYAVDGELVHGWAAFENRVKTGHQDPDEYWPIFVEDVFVDVLDQDFATVTARGQTERLSAAGDTVRTMYAITDVFRKTVDGWKVVNEHESGFSRSPGESIDEDLPPMDGENQESSTMPIE